MLNMERWFEVLVVFNFEDEKKYISMFGDTYLSIITDSHRFRTNKMSYLCRNNSLRFLFSFYVHAEDFVWFFIHLKLMFTIFWFRDFFISISFKEIEFVSLFYCESSSTFLLCLGFYMLEWKIIAFFCLRPVSFHNPQAYIYNFQIAVSGKAFINFKR